MSHDFMTSQSNDVMTCGIIMAHVRQLIHLSFLIISSSIGKNHEIIQFLMGGGAKVRYVQSNVQKFIWQSNTITCGHGFFSYVHICSINKTYIYEGLNINKLSLGTKIAERNIPRMAVFTTS